MIRFQIYGVKGTPAHPEFNIAFFFLRQPNINNLVRASNRASVYTRSYIMFVLMTLLIWKDHQNIRVLEWCSNLGVNG